MRWRARAETWSMGDADATWKGRWQSSERALKQATRWASLDRDDIEFIWLESENGDRLNLDEVGVR